MYEQKIIPNKIVDSTGCGDSFQAGFVSEYLISKDIIKSLENGANKASKTVSHIGGIKQPYSFKEKLIIGMIHLGKLPHQGGNINSLSKQAQEDINILQKGGVNALLIENWEDDSSGPFVSKETSIAMIEIISNLDYNLPLGINVLPNDYRASFNIAKECNLDFVQIDVLSDSEKTNYIYSDKEPFTIKVDKKDVIKHKDNSIIIFASVHPKHYKMLDKKSITKSAKEAIKYGADVLVATGEFTGKEANIKEIEEIKKVISNPIIIGSGINPRNAKEFLSIADGAIVGTSIKSKDFSKVKLEKVKELMEVVKNL